MKKERDRLIGIYGHLYEFKSFGDRLRCAYCDDTRYELDHIPPISWAESLVRSKKTIEFLLVPVCRDCNQILGGRPLMDYESRLSFLYTRIIARMERDKSWKWSDQEIEDDLSGRLQKYVKANKARVVRELKNRLRAIERKLARLDVDY